MDLGAIERTNIVPDSHLREHYQWIADGLSGPLIIYWIDGAMSLRDLKGVREGRQPRRHQW